MGVSSRCWAWAPRLVLLAGLAALNGSLRPAAAYVAPADAGTPPAKTLVRSLGGTPVTLDPQRADLSSESLVIDDLLEGLLAPDGRGGARPALAESWTVSPDGRIYTFKLRADAKWSDGTAVTADDFVFSWRRLADPRTAAPYAYYMWIVVNGEAITRGTIKDVSRLGVTALDATTFQVELVRPTAYFLAMLQHQALFAVQKASVQAHGDAFTEPGRYVSSGAYVLAENVPRDHLTLVRNPAYYDQAKVPIAVVRDLPLEDRAAEMRLFRDGQVQATYELPIDQVAWARSALKEAFVSGDTFDTYFLSFNLRNEPWKSSPALREALTLAIDREALANRVLGGEQPAYSYVPRLAPGPGITGYEPGWPAWRDQPQAERERQARALLVEAGYGPPGTGSKGGPGGRTLPPISLLFPTGANWQAVAVAVARQWHDVLGVEVRLDAQDFRIVAAQSNAKTFKDVVFASWIGDYADANSFLALMRGDAGQENYASYRNPLFDALMEEANGEPDAGRRAGLLRRAERLMMDDTPVIPLFHKTMRRLVSPRVTGWVPNPLDLSPSRFLDLTP
ncbi:MULTISPECIES: peptide ABC transporter substrate-binding protein [Nitrospirillum]|uniref:Oligopeptide transport system substrate-binding protein n=1 Tax=Nitrospirillum amazonense TaxID=28077 RepID=A0A560F763_9PROT|nr:peptide ABC transporter substrate-binding protein [Nitrospirillum amazonense]MEC4594781.1 peptide ABC transporter substrate-binding protein [Nitrospirillum amazonense]TWB17405.1 oligopeptide transport system substrate-binding protein [Nitrospirillum amazonense]